MASKLSELITKTVTPITGDDIYHAIRYSKAEDIQYYQKYIYNSKEKKKNCIGTCACLQQWFCFCTNDRGGEYTLERYATFMAQNIITRTYVPVQPTFQVLCHFSTQSIGCKYLEYLDILFPHKTAEKANASNFK